MDETPEPGPDDMVVEGVTPDQLAGVYSNFALVSHSPYEFTLDFIRRDWVRGGRAGQLVVRVNMAPLFVRQLIDALEENWGKFAQKAMPPEAQDGRGGSDR